MVWCSINLRIILTESQLYTYVICNAGVANSVAVAPTTTGFAAESHVEQVCWQRP